MSPVSARSRGAGSRLVAESDRLAALVRKADYFRLEVMSDDFLTAEAARLMLAALVAEIRALREALERKP